MKASFYKIIFDKETPFRCTFIDKPVFDHPWHFHPAFELTLIVKSEGIQYVGDNISRFEAGNLILLGSNLPHLWANNKTHSVDNEKRSQRITLHFPVDFMNSMFNEAIELEPLVQLFKQSERGISFSKGISEQIAPLLFDIHKNKGLRKWVDVFNLLFQLTEASDYHLLASTGYVPDFTSKDCDMINKIFDHIKNNIENKISLQEMANMACLTKPSFCRYFKKKTGKSFFEFLNEYRINNAKRMLLEDRPVPIGQIALKSGFPSIQHFNSKFKELNNGLTPSNYIKAKRS